MTAIGSTFAQAARAGLPLDVLAGLTMLALVPFLLVMTTSFVRIVVVLSLVRSAIGAASLPPNAVLTGLALLLTFAVMAPTAAPNTAQAMIWATSLERSVRLICVSAIAERRNTPPARPVRCGLAAAACSVIAQ